MLFLILKLMFVLIPPMLSVRIFTLRKWMVLNKYGGGCCWMNPPYGRQIGDWLEKAYISSKENGATVVCLIPARTDTRYWHEYCVKGEMFFLKGRLKFGDAASGAPFPSAIVVFRPAIEDVLNGFSA